MNGGIVPACVCVAASGALFFSVVLKKGTFMELTELEYLTLLILCGSSFVVFFWCVGGEIVSDTDGALDV